MLLASESALKKYNLKPRARILKTYVCGSDPVMQLTDPIPAVRELFKRTGLSMADIDLVEVNEAFASVVLACVKELEIPLDKLNVNGGAIALGHPLGCSGARILATLLINELERRKLKRGLMALLLNQNPTKELRRNDEKGFKY
ncbi:MAG: hypothetical protein ACKO3R_08330 [bacterium]